MSFIQSTLECKGCGHKMNVAFGISGTTQIAGWPTQCPECKGNILEKIADGWQANKITKKKGGLEIVICAAVKSTTGRIIRGHRHGDCFKAILARDMRPSSSQSAQGFITSKNRYVTREVGRKLQDAAGIPSVAEHGYEGTTLYSEDLY